MSLVFFFEIVVHTHTRTRTCAHKHIQMEPFSTKINRHIHANICRTRSNTCCASLFFLNSSLEKDISARTNSIVTLNPPAVCSSLMPARWVTEHRMRHRNRTSHRPRTSDWYKWSHGTFVSHASSSHVTRNESHYTHEWVAEDGMRHRNRTSDALSMSGSCKSIPIRIYHVLHPHMISSSVKAPKWTAYGCYRCDTNSWYHTRTCTAYTCKAYACVCMCRLKGYSWHHTRIYHSSWVKLILPHRHLTQTSWLIEYHACMQHRHPNAYGLGSFDTHSCLTHAYRLGASSIIMSAPS